MSDGRCTMCGYIRPLTTYAITTPGRAARRAHLCVECASPVEEIVAKSDGRRLRADERMAARMGTLSEEGSVRRPEGRKP